MLSFVSCFMEKPVINCVMLIQDKTKKIIILNGSLGEDFAIQPKTN